MIVRHEKWLFIGVYKPPSVHNDSLIESIINVFRQTQGAYRSTFLIGDINIDMLNTPKPFKDCMQIYGLENIITEPTCFKSKKATLLDVVLTDTPRRIGGISNFDIGMSDFHNITCASTKLFVPKTSGSAFQYRSYKIFDDSQFKKDLMQVPFHVAEIFDDFTNKLISDVVNEHAPLKTGRRRYNHVPFMHGELRKAVNVKAMLRRRYNKKSNSANWENYRRQRNLVSKMRGQAINTYFHENCRDVSNKKFWNAIKPFMSSSNKNQNARICLFENNRIVNDDSETCDIFNAHFASVCNDVGGNDYIQIDESIDDINNDFSSHSSIAKIKEHVITHGCPRFEFSPVSTNDVHKELSALNERKSSGYDSLPPNLLKLGKDALAPPITTLVNMSFQQCLFPNCLKNAEVSPVFKKDDSMNKTNFRPVSILVCFSQIFEKLYCDQLLNFFNKVVSKFLSAFRKGYSCETVLIKMIEDWRKCLSEQKIVAAMLIDLSKDCLPHRLLLVKLSAYGLSNDSCNLLMSYLLERKQHVKIGNSRSSWSEIIKGVPQGSILDPLLFNVFINDVFYAIENVYNYADDNVLSCSGDSLHEVGASLESSTRTALKWFGNNMMQANPSKFQAIVFGLKPKEEICFNVNNYKVKATKCVKQLGVYIDENLSFDEYISHLCIKAARQLNSLQRIAKYLSQNTKKIVFNSFILSNFNYCPLVWHICSIKNTQKIEKIQERGLRIILNDYQSYYKALLEASGQELMYISRLKKLACFVYKSYNDTGPGLANDIFNKRDIHYNLRDNSRVEQPLCSMTRL